jgi:hypothetical protein
MLYVKLTESGLPLEVSNDYPAELLDGIRDRAWQNRHDWTSRAQVDGIARYLTAMTGDLYVGTERNAEYDIVRAPKVGDEVSYAFNGDCYPDGTVVKVSKTLIVETSTGKTYRRHRDTGGWVSSPGGTWYLVGGHVYTQNPSF